MRYLQASIPDDKDILDMIRAGINTVPLMADKVYGIVPDELRNAARSRIFHKVRMLQKYDMIRMVGMVPYSKTKIWEVCE